MLKNKKIILAGTLLVAGAIAVAGTFAWFTDSDTVTNSFKLANLDIEIVDTFKFDDNTAPNIQPGDNIEKDVTVKNEGSVPTLVRVKLEETLALPERDQDQDGEVIVEDNEVKMAQAETGYRGLNKSTIDIIPNDDDDTTTLADQIPVVHGGAVTADLSAQGEFDWWYNEADGYFYYLKALETGTETEKLVDQVQFSGANIGNELMYAAYTLTPNAEATQVNADAVRDSWGAGLEDLIDYLELEPSL